MVNYTLVGVHLETFLGKVVRMQNIKVLDVAKELPLVAAAAELHLMSN